MTRDELIAEADELLRLPRCRWSRQILSPNHGPAAVVHTLRDAIRGCEAWRSPGPAERRGIKRIQRLIRKARPLVEAELAFEALTREPHVSGLGLLGGATTTAFLAGMFKRPVQ
jgi:hypothetical protein